MLKITHGAHSAAIWLIIPYMIGFAIAFYWHPKEWKFSVSRFSSDWREHIILHSGPIGFSMVM
jgi:hypothetical protein